MVDRFPAKVTKSGTSKVITIPYLIAEKFKIGDTVEVTLTRKA